VKIFYEPTEFNAWVFDLNLFIAMKSYYENLSLFTAFLFVWWSMPIYGQGGESAFPVEYNLEKFAAALSFPDSMERKEDLFGEKYAKYEAGAYFNEDNKSTYSLLAVHHRGFCEQRADETFYKKFVKRWIDLNDRMIVNTEFVLKGEEKAMQVISKNKEDSEFRVSQVTKIGGNVFIVSVTNDEGDFQKENLISFFETLKINDPGHPEMYQFYDQAAAISFELPIKPVYTTRTRSNDVFGEERTFRVQAFTAKDRTERFNYFMVYRNNPGGIVFEGLEDDFYEIQETYEKRFEAKAKEAKRIMFKGCFSFEMYFEINSSKIHLMAVTRCNKLYIFLIEEYDGGVGFLEKKEAFYDSVTFHPFEYTPLKKQNLSEDIIASFPDTVGVLTSKDGFYPIEHSVDYFSVDSLSSVGYTFAVYHLSPFFSSNNVDSLIQDDIDSLETVEDIVHFADTIFQGQKVAYMIRNAKDSDMIVYELLFYRGPYYFDIMVCGNTETPDSIPWDFFNSIQFTNPQHTKDYLDRDITNSLWKTLESKDSATLAPAKNYLNNNYLQKKDLPKVYEVLGYDLAFDTLDYTPLREIMLDELSNVHDETTLPFLKELYDRQKEDLEFKRNILETLSEIRTEASFQLFFDCLNDYKKDETDQNYWLLFYPLKDTLALTYQFVPELIDLIESDRFTFNAIVTLHAMFKDTLIEMNDIEGLEEVLIRCGDSILVESDLIQSDSIGEGTKVYSLIRINEMLTSMEASETSTHFIEKQLGIQDVYFLNSAIQAAFKKEIEVDSSTFDRVFQDKPGFYSLLLDVEEDSLLHKIPSDLFTQQLVVELFFKKEGDYDYGQVSNYKLLEKRSVKKDGKRLTMYVVQFRFSDYDYPQIGVCTQPADSKKVDVKPFYYDYDNFEEDKISLDDQIDKMLKIFEEWEE